jgi:serine/threonine-protein kinase
MTSFFQQPTVPISSGTDGQAGRLPAVSERYRILEEIATGGMGIVYRAHDSELDRTVALKMIRQGVLANAELLERFQREAQAAARLDHPNIVPIFDIDRNEGRPFFTMPLMRGGSLAQMIRAGGIDPRAAAALTAKIGRAVHFAHEHDILHRDIKPANVLLDEQGEPMVSDFGLAKFLDSAIELTQPQEMLGTPAHMAPEQFPGSGMAASRKTDVWGLGVLLFQLSTGGRPFPGKDRDTLARQICQQEPSRPRTLRPDLDDALETIILRCLRKEPADRYASAAELADDLERWLRGEPILARPETWLNHYRRRLRRHPMAIAAVLLALVFLGAALVTRHYTDPDRPRRQLEDKLKRGEAVVLIPEGGRPSWMRWSLETGGTVGAKRGPFILAADHDLGCLELVTDPQSDSYRYSAEIEHQQGGPQSAAGIYFGRHAVTADGEEQFFCLLAFNDRHAWVTHADGTKTSQAGFLFAGTEGDDVGPYCAPLRGKFFLPGVGNAEQRRARRRVAVEVTPDGVECFWENASLGIVPWEEVEKYSSYLLERLPPGRAKPAQVAAPDVARGGLGLFVRDGSAAFMRADLQPLK